MSGQALSLDQFMGAPTAAPRPALAAAAPAPANTAPSQYTPITPGDFARDDAAIAARNGPMAAPRFARPDQTVADAPEDYGQVKVSLDDFMKGGTKSEEPSKEKKAGTATNLIYQVGRGAVAGTLGAPVDLGAMLINSGARLLGREKPLVPDAPFLGSESIGRGLDAIQNAWDRAIGLPEIGRPPEGFAEKVAGGAGAGAGSVLAPLAAVRALSGVAPQVANSNTVGALTNFFKKPTAGTLATESSMGAASGTGAETAHELFPNSPLAPMVGGIVAPGALVGAGSGTRYVGQSAKKAIAPFTPSGQRQIAGQVLRDSAVDPRALMTPPEPPPITGMRPTLAKETGDLGIAGLEQAAATKNPAAFEAQRAANDRAIRAAGESASEGDAAAIRSAVDERQERLAEAAKRSLDTAGAKTEVAVANATPTGATREGAAENLHRDIMDKHAASEKAERDAWAPINAVQNLQFNAQPIKDAINALTQSLTRSERALLPQTEMAIIKDWGGTEPFAELTSLKSAVGSARRVAERAGDANKARVIGKLERELAEHLDNPALLGDALEGEPNAIKEAYDNARRVTREQKQQFNTDTETADLFKRTGTGDVKVAPTETIKRFVKPGPGGKEAFEALVTALGGPEVLERAASGEVTALNHVRDWAMADIGAKPLSTKNLNAWHDKYAGMLEAFPQLRNDLDHIIGRVARQEQVANRREALTKMLEKNAANTFAEGDPEWALGQLLKSTNLEANDKAVAQFMRFIKHSPEAAEGARRTMVDLLMRSGETGAGDSAKFLSAPGMVKFYEKNRRVFDALFPNPDQRELVDRIVQGVKMNGRAGEGVHATSGPNTAQKLHGVEKFNKMAGEKYIDALVGGGASRLMGLLSAAAGSLSGHGLIGGVVGMAEGPKIFKHFYERPREQVMDLVNEALRDPALARDLMRDITPRNDKVVGPQLIRFLGGVSGPQAAEGASGAP